MIFKPAEVGWRLGRAYEPRGGGLWVPWDRTTGVIGPQGSGKTLDLLAPALLEAPGPALVTFTKEDDLLLSLPVRSRDAPIRWWRSGGPRRSPPAPSRVRSPAGTGMTPPVSMPLKRRR